MNYCYIQAQIKAGVEVDGPSEIISMENIQSAPAGKDTTNNDDIELVRNEESNFSSNEDSDKNENDTIRTSPIKLLLIRTPWYIIGLVVLVTGVVLSQYHIHLPYKAECDDTYNDNFTNSTTTHLITNDFIKHTVSYYP